MAGAMVVATLVGTSAFAESRHFDATARDRGHQSDHQSHDSNRHSSDRNNNQNNQRHDSRSTAPTYQRSDTYRNNNRSYDRSQTYRNDNRSYDRSQTYRNDNRSYDRSQTYRNDNRSYDRSQTYRNDNRSFDRSQTYRNDNRSLDRSRGLRQYDERGRRSMSVEGRVNRFVHERGGYRIWVDGGRFPIWIPEARIGLFPHLRVGLSLRLGGYYDPLGYIEAYDYYDAPYGVYGAPAYSSGLLRGVVETVDYRRGTLVIRDDTSGSFVTTLIRDRQLETLRPGDYAEISGDWTRGGVFEGLRLEDVGAGRY
jgi:hypothetical protein